MTNIVPLGIAGFLIILATFVISTNKIIEKTNLPSASPKNDTEDCNKTFDKPIDVEWTGEVIAQMVSGTVYGIKKTPEDKENPYFYAGRLDEDINKAWEDKKEVGLSGLVRVKGKWVGITDAYRNTIFGRCVPNVLIESIVQ